ncbi:MAG: hypothetical protein IIB17_04140 [Chloroflexi bacterium]|nr:hypothetical protein [Chloroflexota bacterium]
MGFFTGLFGRTKIKNADRDTFFAIIGAADELQGNADLRVLGKAGIVMNPAESVYFDRLDSELRALLRIGGRSTGVRYEIIDDEFGTRWVALDAPNFEDMVSALHLIGETVADHGFGDRLLASVFTFEFQGQKVYWIYNYKTGKFYPFVATGCHQRDNATEMRLGEIMKEQQIPVERKLENWYALWGIPF